MCRNIRTLAHFEPPATADEIHAAALQYVRKVSGSAKPSRANHERFERAVDRITAITTELVAELEHHGPPRNREEEAERARLRSLKRFGPRATGRSAP